MIAKRLLNGFDRWAADLHLRMAGEQPGLSIFLFHSIYEDERAVGNSTVFPQERMTVELFREFLDYFSTQGYYFLTPHQLVTESLDPDKRYGLVTFDDGYFNNTLVLDALKEYRVPALLFISTWYVQEQKSFWSDVAYRELKKRGVSDDKILRQIMALKTKKVSTIFEELDVEFGRNCSHPVGDADRPLTLSELHSMAQHPFIHIGNHTHRHEVLTNLDRAEIVYEIEQCQHVLEQNIGYRPDWISYPNGSYNDTVLCVCREDGFRAGITTVQQKNSIGQLAENDTASLLLSRFNPVAVRGQLDFRRMRASLQLKTRLKQWLQ
jgi:peptidoglycan/xylan/chitin deacetylase (PgdA/CDA1 family)